MVQLIVDKEKCSKDGICAMVCPTKFIKAPPGEFPEQRTTPNAVCLNCGQCVAFCPHQAVTVDTIANLPSFNIDRSLLPTSESLSNLIKSRRSIRLYKNKAVPEEILKEIIETSSYAPTAKNKRNMRFIVIYKKDQIKALGECMVSSFDEYLEKHGTEVQGSVEMRGLSRAWKSGADPIFRGAPHLILSVAEKGYEWSLEDSAIVLTYIEMLAQTYSLGTCWAGYVIMAARRFKNLQKFLELDKNEVICGGQLIGYPKISPKRTAPRQGYPVTWK